MVQGAGKQCHQRPPSANNYCLHLSDSFLTANEGVAGLSLFLSILAEPYAMSPDWEGERAIMQMAERMSLKVSASLRLQQYRTLLLCISSSIHGHALGLMLLSELLEHNNSALRNKHRSSPSLDAPDAARLCNHSNLYSANLS